jgi:uncharacterized metal-binding protein
MKTPLLPLVYSCSGCSNVAQLANDLAVVLDREGHAQMSCIAGVGGNVKGLVKLAQSDRSILAIDGCKIACVKRTLALHQVTPRWHLELSELGLQKKDHTHCTASDMHQALTAVHQLLLDVEDSPTPK